jgi:LysM repeat protein
MGLFVSSLVGGFLASTPCWASTHVVKDGESLWVVAKQHGTSVEAVREASGLRSDRIRPGQKLTIPSAPKKQEPTKLPSPAPSAVKTAPQSAVKAAEPSRVAPPSAQVRVAAERLYSRAQQPASSSLAETAPEWVLAPPGAFTQYQKSIAARHDVDPCLAPDPGFGAYSKWVQVAPMAHVLAPAANPLLVDGGFDVLVHFHGREPVRKEWVQVMDRAVLVAVDVGIDSDSYAEAFKDPRTLRQVLRAVEAEMARRTGDSHAHVRHLVLSAWSAGYGAIEEVLKQPFASSAVEGIVLLDGLHVGFDGASLDQARMAPFVEFSRAAAASERLFFVSHSSITTPGYASSTETARYLVWKNGGRPKAVDAIDSEPMGLERITVFNQGDFHVRGFRGNSAADHCAQLGLMRDVLRVHLLPRWREGTPAQPLRAAPSAPRVPDAEPSAPPAAPQPVALGPLSLGSIRPVNAQTSLSAISGAAHGTSQLAALTSNSATLVQASPLISRSATSRR